MSMGIVVRRIAPLIHDKWNDPAVVVVSPEYLPMLFRLVVIMAQMNWQKNCYFLVPTGVIPQPLKHSHGIRSN